MLEIIDVDFNNPEHGRQVLAMLDEYASGPMGGNTPLPAHVHRDLIPELARRPTARALLARVDGEPAGVAIYLEGFSTFACRPLLNLHDLGVSPRFQGQGVGRRCCPRWSNAAARWAAARSRWKCWKATPWRRACTASRATKATRWTSTPAVPCSGRRSWPPESPLCNHHPRDRGQDRS